MTIHVELMLACDLKDDVPQHVIEILKYVTRKEDYEFNNLPILPAFEGNRIHPWRYLFRVPEEGLDLYYFAGTGLIDFHESAWEPGTYKFTARFEIDTFQELDEMYFPFLEWLAPYVNTEEPGKFVGYFRRTNLDSDHPTLIYFIDGQVLFYQINKYPRGGRK